MHYLSWHLFLNHSLVILCFVAHLLLLFSSFKGGIAFEHDFLELKCVFKILIWFLDDESTCFTFNSSPDPENSIFNYLIYFCRAQFRPDWVFEALQASWVYSPCLVSSTIWGSHGMLILWSSDNFTLIYICGVALLMQIRPLGASVFWLSQAWAEPSLRFKTGPQRPISSVLWTCILLTKSFLALAIQYLCRTAKFCCPKANLLSNLLSTFGF